ncbi:MAG: hypothetical protein AAF763_14800 [Pseudomonadota bacterium]
MIKLRLAAVAALVLLPAAAAQAVTVQNAGFETQGAGTSRTAVGWTQSQNDGRDDAVMPWDAPGPTEGSWLMRLNGGATAKPVVSQTVSGFEVGRTYKLSVDVGNYAARFGSDDGLNFAIEAEGLGLASALFSKDDLGIGVADSPMVTASLIFQADATDMTIRFRGQIEDDSSFVIDDVRINAIPAPLAAPMLLSAFALAAAARRRVRQR